ncbi:MAG: glycosyltransferase family 4 protein [bacterium]|nr:glycosyltransferase family 4 protein [bacterium]
MKKIAILSSGQEKRKDRGYENSSKNLFTNLNSDNSNEYVAHLYKGSGTKNKNEFIVKSFANHKWVHYLGNKRFKDTYVYEYKIFALFYIFYSWFNKNKYDAIYTQEPAVAQTIYKLRFLLRRKPSIIFGMGVKMDPEHYINICDSAQVVNIEHYNKAIKKYPKSIKFYLIPNPGSELKTYSEKFNKNEIRRKYNIKTSNVLVSIGAINKNIKRMNYIVDEAIKLNKNWTLILVGKNQDDSIIEKGKKILGERFIHKFVSPETVPEIIYMADATALASTVEGLPNVVLESMQNGTAPILHKRELNEWITQDNDLLVNMLEENALSKLINSKDNKWFASKGEQCESIYEKNFSWQSLRSKYLDILIK